MTGAEFQISGLAERDLRLIEQWKMRLICVIYFAFCGRDAF